MHILRPFHSPCFQSALLAAVLAGCSVGSVEDEGTPGDDLGDGTGDTGDSGDDIGDDDGGIASDCRVPEYGDGVCQVDLPCAEPDIDCFITFDSQEAGEEFFLRFEDLVAAEEGRDPLPVVSSADPRFARMQDLLDEGWQAYKTVNAVGDLAAASPVLVVVEDPAVNAFVIPDVDTGLAGLVVMVNTGTLDADPSDEALLGLVMHELEHILGLHVIGDMRDRLRTFYIAGDEEPFGFQQDDDQVARDHGELWRVLAEDVGPFRQAELSGLPLGGPDLFSTLFFSVLAGVADDPACEGPIEDYFLLTDEIFETFSALEVDLEIDDPTLDFLADAVMADLRDECLPDFDASLIEVFAELAGITPEELRDSLSPDDLALVEGVHFIDAVSQVEIDRRTRMRQIEESFEQETGRPFSSLRYYSFEEAADDATIPVLENIGIAETGLGEFLFETLGSFEQDECADALFEKEFPPYGADLLDEHHATCWRIAHNEQLADAFVGPSSRARMGSAAARLRRQAPPPSAARSMPRLPPRMSDLIIH